MPTIRDILRDDDLTIITLFIQLRYWGDTSKSSSRSNPYSVSDDGYQDSETARIRPPCSNLLRTILDPYGQEKDDASWQLSH